MHGVNKEGESLVMKNKVKRRRRISALIMLFICIVQISGCAFKSEEKMKQDITDIAEQNEYSIEFINDKEFVITQDEVKYYYKCGIMGVAFEKYETEVEAKVDYEIVDNKGYITVEQVNRDQVEVIQDDDSVYEGYNGEKEIFPESIRFRCTPEFTLESLDDKSFAAALGKGEKEYNKITKCFMSAEKLKEVYENALYIQDQFN